nr:hypothetical protein [Vibrio sp. 10N.286.46.E10]
MQRTLKVACVRVAVSLVGRSIASLCLALLDTRNKKCLLGGI